MKKNFIWNTIGFGLYCFAYAILLIIITRISGLDQAGVFSIVYATANVIAQLALYGGRNYHVTDKTKFDYNGTYIITRLITAAIASIITLILCFVFKYSFSISIVFICLCLNKVVDAISDTYHGILQIDNKLYLAGTSLFFKTVISIVSFAVILYFTNSLVLSSIILLTISLLFLILYDIKNVHNITSYKLSLNKIKFKKIIKDCFFLFCGSFILTYLVNIPKYVLVNFVSQNDQGIFAILIMPAFVVSTLSSFLVQPFLVDLTNQFENNQRKYLKLVVKIIEMIVLIFIVVAIVGYLVGLPIMSILFNTDLSSYKLELMIVIFSSLLYTISSFIFLNLTLLRKIKSLLYLNVIVAVLGQILAYFMIKRYLLFGAYIGFCGIVVLQFILFITYYIIQIKKEIHNK